MREPVTCFVLIRKANAFLGIPQLTSAKCVTEQLLAAKENFAMTSRMEKGRAKGVGRGLHVGPKYLPQSGKTLKDVMD